MANIKSNRVLIYLLLSVLLLTMVSLVICDINRRNNIEWATISEQGATKLRSGDIIFTQGESFKSDIVRLVSNVKGNDFSHCGILKRENNALYVVHMSIDAGRIVQEPISSFMADNRVSSFNVCRALLAVDERAIEEAMADLMEQQVRFDYKYDASERECLYCSELVCEIYYDSLGVDLYPYIDRKRLIYPIEIYNNIKLKKIL